MTQRPGSNGTLRHRGRVASATRRGRRARRAAAGATRAVTGKPGSTSPDPRGKNILLIGATGFVGKVALSMLLHRYPDVGQGVLPGPPGRRQHRRRALLQEGRAVAGVRPAARACTATASRRSCARRSSPIAGDVGRPLCNFTDAQFDELRQRWRPRRGHQLAPAWSSFTPSLESALRINTMGAKNVLDVARKTGAAAGPRVDLLRRRPARRRGLGGRAGGRLLPARRGERLRRDRRAARSRLRSGRRDRRLPAHHRPGARARERPRSTSRSSASARRRGAARRRAATRRRGRRSSSRWRASARSGCTQRAHQARHGARRSTGAGPTRTRTPSRSASRSSCRRPTCRSTIVRPAIVESGGALPVRRAGTRASTPPRRWCT